MRMSCEALWSFAASSQILYDGLSWPCAVAFCWPWPFPSGALVVDSARLLYLHKTRLFQQGNSPFAPALADAGITDYGSHVYVDEAILQRGRTQAERSKVKVGQDSLNDDLTRLAPF